MRSSVEALRERIPLLSERVYCASQCLGPVLHETFDALDAYRRTLTKRSRALDAWIERHEALHGSLERLLNAPQDSVFIAGTATGVHGAVAASLSPKGASRRIVISSGDFHSTRYLWRAQERRGFAIDEVDSNGPAHGVEQTFLDAIDERTAIVALSLVSPRSGALLPVEAIAARCREVSALLVLDAYQAVGIVPVDVRSLGADVVVGGTHKWLHGAGTGVAFGYVEPELAETLRPAYPGWIGHASMLDFGDRFIPHRGARRFEQGTPAMEAVYTSGPGVDAVLEVGVEALRQQSLRLTEHLATCVRARGWDLRTPERRGGMLCVGLEAPNEVVEALAADGIDVDARPGAGVRIGPHPCQTIEEMDRILCALDRVMR
ncbi:MAG: aminotransferase class V-fold PLP-dependent enzyme [Sandaracinaceae bacterium]